jgi:tetratricopeptide (TPR) repeat protein
VRVGGISLPQGSGRKNFSWRPGSFYKLAIAILIVSIFAGNGQAGLFNNKKNPSPPARKSVESDNLSPIIKQLVRELEYSDKTAEDFVAAVNGWKNKKANQLFAAQRQKLYQVRENYRQGTTNIADVAKVEQDLAAEIAWLIGNEITCADEEFELTNVLKNKKANCLGCLQLFYILGNSISLSVIPINAVELRTPGSLPMGTAHVSCMVSLSDGRTIMLNPMPNGFVSSPFIIEKEFTKIENYWELKDKDNSLDIYRKIQILDKNGLIAYIYSNRGNVYASGGQLDQSICNYNRALELDPNLAEAYNNRGITYCNFDKPEQAVADCTKAIELNLNYAQAYNNRGIAYGKLGRLDMAIRDYDKSIELNPKFAEAYNNRANAYVKSNQFDQAISDYTRAIKNNSNFAKAYGNRAITYALLKKTQEARKDFLKAIELNPDLKNQITVLAANFKLDSKFN